MIPFIIGGWFEVGGYIGRVLSTIDQWLLSYYIVQTLFLLVAPALFAASIYMTLGRIIHLVDGERHSLVRAKWLTKIFVAGDVLSFCTQGAGAGLMSGGTADKLKTGENIVVGGLCLQILSFGLFTIVAIIFHRRILKSPTHVTLRTQHTLQKRTWKEKLLGSSKHSKTTSPDGTNYEPNYASGASAGEAVDWQKHLYALYVASMLILVRSLFRVIEYVMGNNGYLLKKEVFLYIFDAVLMFLCMVWLNIVHPGEIHSGRSRKERKARRTEEEGFDMEERLDDGKGGAATHVRSNGTNF